MSSSSVSNPSSMNMNVSAQDQCYAIDNVALDSLRTDKPFLRDAQYFKNVKISPSATMKMMMHVQSGVEKGIKTSVTGKPTEVMAKGLQSRLGSMGLGEAKRQILFIVSRSAMSMLDIS